MDKLKVNDTIYEYDSSGVPVGRLTVVKLTPTGIANCKTTRHDSIVKFELEIGSDGRVSAWPSGRGYFSSNYYIETPELKAEYSKRLLRLRIKRLLKENIDDYSVDQLLEIEKIMDVWPLTFEQKYGKIDHT